MNWTKSSFYKIWLILKWLDWVPETDHWLMWPLKMISCWMKWSRLTCFHGNMNSWSEQDLLASSLSHTPQRTLTRTSDGATRAASLTLQQQLRSITRGFTLNIGFHKSFFLLYENIWIQSYIWFPSQTERLLLENWLRVLLIFTCSS